MATLSSLAPDLVEKRAIDRSFLNPVCKGNSLRNPVSGKKLKIELHKCQIVRDMFRVDNRDRAFLIEIYASPKNWPIFSPLVRLRCLNPLACLFSSNIRYEGDRANVQ
ncbi:MAG: hypothetical protein AB1861_16995 [Cyanobacteriota bacterium]